MKKWLKQPKHQVYAVLLGMLLLIQFVWLPIYNLRAEWLDSLSFVLTQTRDEDSIRQATEQLQTNIDALRNKQSKLGAYFSGVPGLAQEQLQFLKQIETMAEELGIEKGRRQWKTSNIDEQITESQLQIRFTGRGADLQELAKRLSEFKPKLHLSQLVLARDTNSLYQDFNFDLTISYYHLKRPS
ncbi:hypothetical protein P2G88_04545 [Aliiglaciecola sp. CAU 1673]|uniref:hypothetical protein n=1 Tax=Aliiglaciecola sp. CAU 1673 TaxID=3032595 RepID=UPI0023DBD133|nr:hypothetical protein [Aliiglaciecola sp. CAU 1673]MDF2177515.1 hypothetical protein [Aliiglaciecola sp. CAU 1673]